MYTQAYYIYSLMVRKGGGGGGREEGRGKSLRDDPNSLPYLEHTIVGGADNELLVLVRDDGQSSHKVYV